MTLLDGSFTGSITVKTNGQTLVVYSWTGPLPGDLLYSNVECTIPAVLSTTIVADTTYYWKRPAAPSAGSAVRRGRLVVKQADGSSLGTNGYFDVSLIPYTVTVLEPTPSLLQLADDLTAGDSADAATYSPLGLQYPVGKWRNPLDGITWVTRFQTGHGWTIYANGTTMADDATKSGPVSAQTIRAVTEATGGSQGSIEQVDLSVDLSGANRLVIPFQVESGYDEFGGLTIYVGDNSFTNYYLTYAQADGFPRVNGWQYAEFALNDVSMTSVGSPDASSITHIKIVVQTSHTATGGAVVRLGGVGYRASTLYPNGVITLSFDDGSVSQFTRARPVLGAYGYAAEANIITEFIDSGVNYLTTQNLRDLEDESGWDICAHSDTIANHDAGGVGFPALSGAELEAAFRAMRTWLNKRGFTSTVWATPKSGVNDAVWNVAKEYFTSARTAGVTAPRASYGIIAPTMSPWRIPAYTYATGELAAVEAAVDATKANSGWLLINLHDIVASGATAFQINAADLATLVAYIHSAGVEVETTSRVREKTRLASVI